MADISRTTILKTTTDLETNLKFLNVELNTIKAKFIAASREGANKPTQYGADQEYTELFKLGPVVSDLAEAVKKLETELAEMHRYIGEQLGRDPNVAEMPAAVKLGGTTQMLADANGDITFTSLVS